MVSFTYMMFLLLNTVINAQVQTPLPPPPPPGLPIDSGLPILLIVGILFGVYMIYHTNIKTTKKPL